MRYVILILLIAIAVFLFTHPMQQLIFVAILILLAYCFLHGYWLRYQAVGRPFHYHISDIWAAMAGLAPTLFAATNLETWRPVLKWDLKTEIFIVVAMGLFQIAGLAAGRMDLETRQNEANVGPVTGLNSAISILAGAYFGLLMSAPFVLGIYVYRS